LKQTITDLVWIIGNANKDHEEERNLHGDLPWDRSNPLPIPKYDDILFYEGRFSKQKFIKWLIELEAYFYFKKVPYHL
jgi:hypothetical protein